MSFVIPPSLTPRIQSARKFFGCTFKIDQEPNQAFYAVTNSKTPASLPQLPHAQDPPVNFPSSTQSDPVNVTWLLVSLLAETRVFAMTPEALNDLTLTPNTTPLLPCHSPHHCFWGRASMCSPSSPFPRVLKALPYLLQVSNVTFSWVLFCHPI